MTKLFSRPAWLALPAMILLAACAQAPRYATSEFKSTQVAVEVDNHNWMDVTVYAVTNGNRVRLGTVTTGLSQTFRVPPALMPGSGDFHLEAQPVGSGEVFSSGTILVQPGSRIQWSLENQLALSSYRIASAR